MQTTYLSQKAINCLFFNNASVVRRRQLWTNAQTNSFSWVCGRKGKMRFLRFTEKYKNILVVITKSQSKKKHTEFKKIDQGDGNRMNRLHNLQISACIHFVLIVHFQLRELNRKKKIPIYQICFVRFILKRQD